VERIFIGTLVGNMDIRTLLESLDKISESASPDEIQNLAFKAMHGFEKAKIGKTTDYMLGQFDTAAEKYAGMSDAEAIAAGGKAGDQKHWQDYKKTRSTQPPSKTHYADMMKAQREKSKKDNPEMWKRYQTYKWSEPDEKTGKPKYKQYDWAKKLGVNVGHQTESKLDEGAAEEWYQKQILNNDATSQASVGWLDSEGSQHKRFAKLLDIGVCKEDSVLDVGCGIGHLYEYVGDQIKYYGIDPNKLAIKKAKELYPKGIFAEGIIANVSRKFDWALISGVFNLDFPREQMVETINLAISKVNKGVAFNFLTGQENPDPVLEFYQPDEIKQIFETHNPEVIKTLDVTDDFTVYIRK
jgi:SAM-dependent methyltransferase